MSKAQTVDIIQVSNLGETTLSFMTHQQFDRLRKLELATKRYSSFRNTNRPSKRSVKANGNGTGQVLKHSRIKPEVWIERVFTTRN